jgi:serine O-acetyltransferase
MTTGLNLGIEPVVTQLRELREQALHHRQRDDKPPRLPSRKAPGCGQLYSVFE